MPTSRSSRPRRWASCPAGAPVRSAQRWTGSRTRWHRTGSKEHWSRGCRTCSAEPWDAACRSTANPPPPNYATDYRPLLLLARETSPGLLGWSLDYLLDALVPDSIDQPDQRDYHLELVPVLDGDWDLRGHLDHETGTLLAAELARQARIRERTAAQGARDIAGTATKTAGSTADGTADGTDDNAGTSDMFDPDLPQPSGPDARLRGKGQWRHDDLRQLLRDAADRDAGRGQPAPVAITLFASADAVEARAGALPGLLITPGRPVSLPTDTLRRMGCHSQLTAVLLDAAGRPVGASTTRRTADRRQRAALHALWGPWCAIAGCTRTITVPHHVRPWWLSHQTALDDLLPLCAHDHHDLHEGHRTLRLEDGRHIDQHGWVDNPPDNGTATTDPG